MELRDGSVKRFSKDEGLVYSALDSRYGLLLGYKGRGLVNSRTGEATKQAILTFTTSRRAKTAHSLSLRTAAV